MSFAIRFSRPGQPAYYHAETTILGLPKFVETIQEAKDYPTLNDVLEAVSAIRNIELSGDPMEITPWMLHKLKLCSVAVETMFEGYLFNTLTSKTKIEIYNRAAPARPVHRFSLNLETT